MIDAYLRYTLTSVKCALLKQMRVAWVKEMESEEENGIEETNGVWNV